MAGKYKGFTYADARKHHNFVTNEDFRFALFKLLSGLTVANLACYTFAHGYSDTNSPRQDCRDLGVLVGTIGTEHDDTRQFVAAVITDESSGPVFIRTPPISTETISDADDNTMVPFDEQIEDYIIDELQQNDADNTARRTIRNLERFVFFTIRFDMTVDDVTRTCFENLKKVVHPVIETANSIAIDLDPRHAITLDTSDEKGATVFDCIFAEHRRNQIEYDPQHAATAFQEQIEDLNAHDLIVIETVTKSDKTITTINARSSRGYFYTHHDTSTLWFHVSDGCADILISAFCMDDPQWRDNFDHEFLTGWIQVSAEPISQEDSTALCLKLISKRV